MPFSYTPQDKSSGSIGEASHRWLESDNMDAYKLDSGTHESHSWICAHTKNMKYDHKLEQKKPKINKKMAPYYEKLWAASNYTHRALLACREDPWNSHPT